MRNLLAVGALIALAGCGTVRLKPSVGYEGTLAQGSVVLTSGDKTCAHLSVGVDPVCIAEIGTTALSGAFNKAASTAEAASKAVSGK